MSSSVTNMRSDRLSTPDELRLAAAEEERQRLAVPENTPSEQVPLGLGQIISGIFGPLAVKGK